MSEELKDVFLSHTSKDKDRFVRPFAKLLDTHGITYWLDEGEIKWGDRITRKINHGLRRSKYVIIFLSDNFLGRNWPEAELEAALNKETTEGRTIVLPIIIGDRELIIDRYPLLRDKLYLEWENGPVTIVEQLRSLLSIAARDGDRTRQFAGDNSDVIADVRPNHSAAGERGRKTALVPDDSTPNSIFDRTLRSELLETLKALPAVKYALVIGAVQGAVAIVLSLKISWAASVISTVILLFLVLLLLMFSRLSRSGPRNIKAASSVLSSFFSVLMILTPSVLLTSFFWGWPRTFVTYLHLFDVSQPSPTPTATPTVAPVPLSDLIALAKRAFWFDYPHPDPGPGRRYWLQIDDYTWIERYPDGSQTMFRITGPASVKNVSGTFLLKIQGDPKVTQVPDDGSFQVFIPDNGSSSNEVLFRHFRNGAWGEWGPLCIMNVIK